MCHGIKTDTIKNLDKDVREKAIEIANALLNEGYKEGKAIPIAIDRAKMAVKKDWKMVRPH
ncbi:hypothetical protein ASG99_20480 [Bacillus sp. Soil768D1]|nr:hypothetical protein ASG99_20480 [Bacillus sp. Soil768D1]